MKTRLSAMSSLKPSAPVYPTTNHQPGDVMVMVMVLMVVVLMVVVMVMVVVMDYPGHGHGGDGGDGDGDGGGGGNGHRTCLVFLLVFGYELMMGLSGSAPLCWCA